MDFESLDLVMLSEAELHETDGGIIPFLVAGACLLLAGCQSGSGNRIQVGGVSAPPGTDSVKVYKSGDTNVYKFYK